MDDKLNRLIWFRNDLRVHDNETLTEAIGSRDAKVSFLVIYDEAWDQLTPEGFPRFGPSRKRFIAESVIDLRNKLRALGAELICAYGDPAEVVAKVCAQLNVNEVFHARYATHDEMKQDRVIAETLRTRGVNLRSFHTHAMLHPDDFPEVDFTRSRGYSKLRKIAETDWNIRAPLSAITGIGPRANAAKPSDLTPWRPEDFIDHPTTDLGIHLKGGESAALARIQRYFWDADRLRVYKDSRNGLIDLDDSSKFSGPLSLGCVSARHLYAEVRRYERERVANASTLWFLYELLWRDHFHFLALHRGRHLFTDPPKFPTKPKTPDQQRGSFAYWRMGKTGKPFVDAAMNELRSTGWMSNRMRQNVASYLIFDLGVEWQWGARWFESCLVDYDCASNWGNWSYVAGAGPMNSPHRFDVDQQARAYDPDGAYARYWSTT